MDAKQKQGMAVLEEWLQEKYVEYYDEVDKYTNKVELLAGNMPELFLKNNSSRNYIIYNGKMYYVLNKKSLPKEIREGLVGGDSDDVVDFSKLIDVYGVTEELTVYYVDTLNGTQYGNMEANDVNPDLPMAKLNSDLKMKEFITKELAKKNIVVDEEKGITFDNVNNLPSSLTIDGVIDGISSLEALSEIPNLQQLTLNNMNLENLKGIDGLSLLYYVYFDNCIVNDYTSLASVYKLKELYFYFPPDEGEKKGMSEIDCNNQITRLGEGLKNASNINGLEKLYILGRKETVGRS